MKSKFLYIFLFLLFNGNSGIYAQTLKELQKLKDEYSKVLDRQALQKSPEIQEAESRASSTALPDKLIYSRKDVESLLVNTQKLLEELKFVKDSVKLMNYVGYDLFTKRDSVPFWQNLPLPKDYVLGPGDEVIISLWGEVNLYFSETINRDGQIFIENVGLFYLGDKTLSSAKDYVFKRFSQKYSTLIGGQPKTYIDISIGDLKSLNVHFVGYVNLPGIHMLHPFSNVLSGLSQAGGVSNKGSLRQIQLIRNDEIITTIDLYDYIFYGKSKSDLRLLDQDVIYIPPRKSTITVSGNVLNPGYFEAKDGESLKNVIDVSGGLNHKSFKKAFVYRRGNHNESSVVNEENFADFSLIDGDSISIIENIDYVNYVQIGGQVKNPGAYPFHEGMTIKDLFNYTQSSKDEEFFRTIDLSNIVLNRVNLEKGEIERIKISLDSNLFLLNNDIINVGVKKFQRKIKTVNITGQIQNPGIYAINDQTSLQQILDLAGGFTPHSLKKGIQIFRDSLKIGWENTEFLLEDKDSLNILVKSGLVLVEGQVNSPGFLSYKSKYSVKKYIELAGGFSSFAERDNIYILYPNGISKPFKKWGSPKVVEGSTIIVNERLISAPNKRNGALDTFSSITSQAGALATTLLSLILISNQLNGQ